MALAKGPVGGLMRLHAASWGPSAKRRPSSAFRMHPGMTISLFDPDHPAGQDHPAGRDRSSGSQARPITLVRLSAEIARSVAVVGRIAVEGEVHRPTTSRGGWIFFNLRDRAAQLDVKVSRANTRHCRAVAGERVCVVGKLEWSPDRAQLHLAAEEVVPVGAGAIAALIAETRRRLAAEGLIARARRPLPVLPACIGVVCGADAAVRKDIESVVVDRFPGYPVYFEETTVSGPGAALSIVEALARVVSRAGVEVVVLARGGGDAPSLLPWSDEEVCRAVCACPVPTVSAIGHDGDRPLCDEVADLRCGTPSIAAAVVVPDRLRLVEALDRQRQAAGAFVAERLAAGQRRSEAVNPARALREGMTKAQARAEAATRRLELVHPERRLGPCRQRLAAPDWRRLAGEVFGRAEGRIQADRRHLSALSPQRVLERGYAVVTGPSGAVLRDVREVAVGDEVGIRLATGNLRAQIAATEPDNTGVSQGAAR